MGVQSIGEIIRTLRAERKITRETLCNGLCSGSMLAKIENGDRMPEIVLVDGLLKRLGKSPDKLEVIVSYYEYKKMEDYDRIIDDLRNERYKQALAQISAYESAYGKNKGLDAMFIKRLYAIVAYQKEKNYGKAEKLLDEAIAITLPDFNIEHIKPFSLSTFEIENLLMRCYVWMQRNKAGEAKKYLDGIMPYIKKCVTDEEEYAKIYPKAAYLRSLLAVEEHDYINAVNWSKEALNTLVDQFLLIFVTAHLELLIESFENMGQVEEKKYCLCHKSNIEELYKLYGMDVQSVNVLYYSPSMRHCYLDSEIIKDARMKYCLKQSDFIEGIYSDETSLSRVETGKIKMSKSKFSRTMEKIKLEKDRYNCYLTTNDFEMLERFQDILKNLSRNEIDEVERKFNAFMHETEGLGVAGEQQLGFINIMLKYKKGTMSKVEAADQLTNLLQESYYTDGQCSFRIPFQNEALMLVQLAKLYNQLGEKEKAAAILGGILKTYDESKILRRYNYRNVSLMEGNLCKYLEELGKTDEAIQLAEQTNRMELQLGKAGGLCQVLIHEASAMRKNEISSLERVVKSYYLCQLLGRQRDSEVIRRILKEKYEFEVD